MNADTKFLLVSAEDCGPCVYQGATLEQSIDLMLRFLNHDIGFQNGGLTLWKRSGKRWVLFDFGFCKGAAA